MARPRATKRVAVDETPGVRVRMYRMGLGDCFLLTFNGSDHILIDCGILTGTPGGAERARDVAGHIRKTTGGRLRALVATHEHWDHVSGFSYALETFKKFEIDEVWAAWTEDPSQQIAAERKAARNLRLRALNAAIERLGVSQSANDWERAGAIGETLGFFGERSPEAPGGSASATMFGFSKLTDEAMSWITDPARKPKFWSPGDTIQREWLGEARVHVLGPPMNRKQLGDLTGQAGDMYGLSGEELGLAAALGVEDETTTWLPFDRALQWAGEAEWLERYVAGFAQQYRGESWRRIDSEWLAEAEQLALQLDNATNNTSLVLAFELTAGGKVLLFPGDAQIGNWKSWAAKHRDLLARTVLYKVSHHASHNGTLTEHGLEAMGHPDLVAMVPVNEVQAKGKRPIPWMMPADALYTRLLEKTKGRILRSDRDISPGSDEWRGAGVTGDPMFFDLFVKTG